MSKIKINAALVALEAVAKKRFTTTASETEKYLITDLYRVLESIILQEREFLPNHRKETLIDILSNFFDTKNIDEEHWLISELLEKKGEDENGNE